MRYLIKIYEGDTGQEINKNIITASSPKEALIKFIMKDDKVTKKQAIKGIKENYMKMGTWDDFKPIGYTIDKI